MSLKSIVHASALGASLGGLVLSASMITAEHQAFYVRSNSIAYTACSQLVDERDVARDKKSFALYELDMLSARQMVSDGVLNGKFAARYNNTRASEPVLPELFAPDIISPEAIFSIHRIAFQSGLYARADSAANACFERPAMKELTSAAPEDLNMIGYGALFTASFIPSLLLSVAAVSRRKR